MTRRGFLGAGVGLARSGEIRREVFLRSPGKGTAVMALAWYTGRRGVEMASLEQRWSRSDTIDVAFYRRSFDNGRKWSAPVERRTGEKTAGGMLRRHPRGGWVDPRSGRLVEFWLEAVLPTDDPLEGLRAWDICYRIGGGKAVHRIPRREGEGSLMLGDMASQPLSMPDGRILLPVQLSPLNPDGTLYNPGGGYTYHHSLVLHGRWKGGALAWERSELIRGDPARSTRGAVEPTIARLGGNRLICVLRGSNDSKPELPGWRWVTYSDDGGYHWTAPKPWTYHNGEPFYSPSSCSQLVEHTSGRLYWLGNVTAQNPRGNRPRYPFVVGEVDRDKGLLVKDSVRTVDTLQPGEDPILTLSNFYAREDRESREIALHMTRLFAKPDGWEGDAMVYRIPA